MTRVVLLPVFDSPPVDGSSLLYRPDVRGCIHVPLVTDPPAVFTAGKFADLTAPIAWSARRALVVSPRLTLHALPMSATAAAS